MLIPGLFLALAWIGPCGNCSAAQQHVTPVATAAGANAAAGQAGLLSGPQPLMAAWYHDAAQDVKSLAGTRKGMITFGLIGVGLALWIIWYRR